MIKKGLIIGVLILFILSSFTTITFSQNSFVKEESIDETLNFDSFHASEKSNREFKQTKSYNLKTSTSPSSLTDTPVGDEPMQVMNSGLMNSSWPMLCHDARHTGRSPYCTVEYPIEKWRCYLDFSKEGASPVIDKNGTIYFSAIYLYAICPNGTIKWKSEEMVFSSGCLAIAEDGTIYTTETTGWPSCTLSAYYPDGTLKWDKGYADRIYSSPAIGPDGTIYFGCEDNRIYAVNPDSTDKWTFNTDHVVYSSPVIGEDGTVYCGSHDQNLYAIYPNNGTEKWRYHTDDWIRVSPCIGDDGTVYAVSLDGYLHAVYPNNGTLKWKTYCGAGTHPTIGQDGTIYCGYDKLYAINHDGSVKWIFENVRGAIRAAAPCNSIDGTIYFGNSDGEEIVAVNPDGAEKWRKVLGKADSAPCISEDGTLYIASDRYYDNRDTDTYLHAFGTVDNNTPPKMEAIEGPAQGEVGQWYSYWISASDPDNNPVAYFVDWGDGSTDGWTIDYAQNVSIHFPHRWESQGFYEVKAKARDSVGAESNWSEPLVVNMTTETNSKFKNRLLYLAVIIQNKGDYDLHNIEWELNIYPMETYFSKLGDLEYPTEEITGSTELLKGHRNLYIRSRIRGIGFFNVHLVYNADEMPYAELNRGIGFVLGPFILFCIEGFWY